MKRILVLLFVLMISWTLFAPAPGAAQSILSIANHSSTLSTLAGQPYKMIDIGTLGGANAYPSAFNNAGQVIGGTYDVNYDEQAFFWQDGKMRALGTLGGQSSGAYAINNLGQVVGSSEVESGVSHAFLWQDGVMTDLGALAGGQSSAIDINDRGQVIGVSWIPDHASEAVLWQNGAMTPLGPYEVVAINEQGQIIGTSTGHLGVRQAFLWENGETHYLGTLGGQNTYPLALNDLGQVVGNSEISSGTPHAFLWESGIMTDLGALADTESYARFINNRGQVSGNICAANRTDCRAVLWENGVMTDLGMFSLVGMNEQGQIIGADASGTRLSMWENGVVTDLDYPPGDFSFAFDINDRGQILFHSIFHEDSSDYQRVYLATNIPPFPEQWLLLSASTGGKVGGVAFADEDILAQNLTTRAWQLYFDGSDVGITDDVDAFGLLPDNSLLLSFGNPIQVPGLGVVDDSDIVRFLPTSVGSHTSGTFRWYLDGSDVNLTTGNEDIDAIHVLPDGRLIVSTLGHMDVAGTSGADEDLFVLRNGHYASESSGKWGLYFDGSDVGLTQSSEDVWGMGYDAQTGAIYLSTKGDFKVKGLSGRGADIFVFHPAHLAEVTVGTFEPFWRGADYGFGGEIIDDFEIVDLLPASEAVTAAAEEPFTPELGDDVGDDVLDDTGDEAVDDSSYDLFLPLLQNSPSD